MKSTKGFVIKCTQCGWEEEFSMEEQEKRKNNDYYFDKDKISITASGFVSPPEITISCQNPECDNYA